MNTRSPAGARPAMGNVDVQRAFHSMTLPPPKSGEHEWRAAIPIEEGDRVGLPIVVDGEPYECLDLDPCSQDELDAQVADAISAIEGILRAGPQPIQLVIDMLVCGLDLDPRCAQSLFWRTHERGLLSLSGGQVHLGHVKLRR
jgi:hypothetical protein